MTATADDRMRTLGAERSVNHSNWMLRALALARRGEALTSPNPMVGAVLVKNGKTVGEGFHTYEGLRHAEIVALGAAGTAARGATLYVNLEPCSHTGRTPPCTRSIVAAGVTRVVAAIEDPNPEVAGRGFRQLRAAGIDVVIGVHEEDARRLNEAFAKWIATLLPFVLLKSALTLDHQLVLPPARGSDGGGKARRGRRRWITSVASRAEVQRMRHASDALLTGIGTALADDPLLTDRTGLARRRPLLRVVLDSRLRLDPRSRLVRSAQGDVLIFTCASESSPRARALRAAGVEVIRIAPTAAGKPGAVRRGGSDASQRQGERPSLRAVLAELGQRQITSVLLESGATLNDAALAEDLVDKIRLFYAPIRAFPSKSGEASRKTEEFGTLAMPASPAAASSPTASHWGGRPASHIRVDCFGRDVAIEAYLHDVYARPARTSQD